MPDKGLANWKAFLAENPMEVITYLNTPIERDLTPEEIAAYKALHTNYPTTVISNDEAAHMEVSYVADTKNYIAKVNAPLQKQITELQNALISQKISGGGIKVSDSARVPVIKFSMWGKTQQVQTTGAQLFDVFSLRSKTMNGITFDILQDGGVHVYGTATAQAYMTPAELHIPPGMYFASSKIVNKNISFFVSTAPKNSNNWKEHSEKVVTVLETEKARAYLNVMGGFTVDDVVYPMLNKGDTSLPWEPYSGGKPSPSPEYPQPIEVTDKPITVTVKGGTEQQSITLVPPKPLTKWDKLEKIDGVWKWGYQSKVCMLSDIATEWVCFTVSGIKQYYFSCNDCFHEGNKNNIYADKFKSWTVEKREDNYGTVYLGKDAICFNVDKFSTLENWKDWVSANPVNILYKTKEIEYIPLSQPEQDKLNSLTMYAPTTEITNDGGCNMELTYTVDTKSYVDTKIAEISKAIL